MKRFTISLLCAPRTVMPREPVFAWAHAGGTVRGAGGFRRGGGGPGRGGREWGGRAPISRGWGQVARFPPFQTVLPGSILRGDLPGRTPRQSSSTLIRQAATTAGA